MNRSRDLYLILAWLLFIRPVNAQDLGNGDTLVIHPITFDTPSPEGWLAQYKRTLNFPLDDISWSKILMVQTLKCDPRTKADKYECGEWDYIWDTMVHVPNKDTIETFKLGSFVTPYGKRLYLGGDEGWVWKYDITDYAPILKGQLDLTVGNNQELLDLKFFFIKGIPSRDAISVENIFSLGNHDSHYGYTYTYGELSNNTALTKRQIILDPSASGYKLKAIISGHGHEGPDYCCEWVNKSHSYIINGSKMFTWNVWKDCGNNPIYPQGGTWPYDRAGWCPGTKVDEYSFELTNIVTAGDTISIDYEIETMVNESEAKGIFRMSHQLFSYGKPNFKYNVEIAEIIVPSTEDRYSRINPTLSNPRIIIRNNGSEDIRLLKIKYGLEHGSKYIYRWKGVCPFLMEQEIHLPIPDWSGLSNDRSFMVEAIAPNGRKDEYPIDNIKYSKVLLPKVLPNEFMIRIRTNDLGRSLENAYEIRDNTGATYFKSPYFEDNTDYKIPIKLDPGIYDFIFTDEKENGIDLLWWQQKDSIGTSGILEFMDVDGSIIHHFNSDFGQEIRMNFLVGDIP